MTTPNVEQICLNCLFYLKGFCHRYPPQIINVDKVNEVPVLSAIRPSVEKTDHCGEWQVFK